MAHEFGGWPEADLVQAVDSLSFLETNIDLFLGFVRSGKHPAHEVRKKFNSMFGRIQIPRLKVSGASRSLTVRWSNLTRSKRRRTACPTRP